MITREVDAGLLCFRQTDHALLAGRLAARWGGGVPALRRRESFLRAVSHHDAGWEELDRRPAFDPATGSPHTYLTQGLDSALAVADRSIERVGSRDPYAGWLVGRHFLSFHERDDRAEARRWREAVRARLALLLEEIPDHGESRDLEPAALEKNLDQLQLLDALSLALFQAWPAWVGRPMRLDDGGGRVRFRYRTTRSADLLVEGRLEPWPFAPDRLEEAAPAHLLGPRRWRDEAALRQAWDSAPVVEVELRLSPS